MQSDKAEKTNQEKLYRFIQTKTYPEADSHSYIDDETNGFREHAWSDEQYGKGNYTDESSYVKHMPDGYEVDLKKNYTIPKKKAAKSEKSESTEKKDKKSDSTESNSKKKTNSGAKELNETQIQNRLEKAMKDTYDKKDKKSKSSFVEVFNPAVLNEQHGSPNLDQNSGGKPIYPAKDSHSTIEPYNQRDHAFNDEQYHNSSEKTWNESSPNGMPLADTYAFNAFKGHPIYPAKDSHSEILPYNQRDHAFNDEQYHNSSEKTWNESTPNGMPLADTYAFNAIKGHPIYPAKDSHSEILPYNQRDHAFNDEQYHNSSEKTWNESSPNGMPLADTYAFNALSGHPIYPAKDSHSTIEPYNQRDHAFNDEQYHNSSEKTWNESSPNGMPLADTYAFNSI